MAARAAKSACVLLTLAREVARSNVLLDRKATAIMVSNATVIKVMISANAAGFRKFFTVLSP